MIQQTGIPVRLLSTAEIGALLRADDTDLAGLRDELRGVFRSGPRALRLHGLDLAMLGEAGFSACFERIGGWLGTLSPQSPRGERVARVEHVGVDPFARGTSSNSELRAHTDMHDILALGCVRPASHGGESFLVKSDLLFRRIQAEAPRYLPALLEGYYWGTNPALQSRSPVSLERIPVFIPGSPGEVALCCCNGYFLRAAAASRGERLPDALEQALEVIQRIAVDLADRFLLAAGDIAIWHNWSWLHGRSAFANAARSSRLLLRLWLRSDLILVPAVWSDRARQIDADHEFTRLQGMQAG